MLVAVRHGGRFSWYESDDDLWILDQRAFAEAFRAAGHPVDVDDHADRFGIAVVDRANADEFLGRMQAHRLEGDLLRELFLAAVDGASGWWDVADFVPSVFVDFDRRELWTVHGEGTPLEDFVPRGWEGSYGGFFDRLPVAERYWIRDGVDLLAPFLG